MYTFEIGLLLHRFQLAQCHARAGWFLGSIAMARIKWSDLPSRASTHCVVMRLAGEIFSGKQTLDLMARYMRLLHSDWTYALTISRESGEREIWCGFGHSCDAVAFAKAINAKSEPSDGWATKRVLTADDAYFVLIQAAAPPPDRKRAKPAELERRGSQITVRMRRRNYEDPE